MTPGVYEISQEEYHKDPCPEPSLSCSIGKILLDETPIHAWTAHPRLNPNHEHEGSDIFDLGSAAHSLVLKSEEEFVIVPFSDYRKNDAKQMRDDARAAHKIPVLESKWPAVQEMADACRRQLAVHPHAFDAFLDGRPERMIVWQEETPYGDIWCRALIDWLPNDTARAIYDYKTTGATANPDYYTRQFFNLNYDVQAAFYSRGLRKVEAWDGPDFRFIVQENTAPFALSVIGMPPEARELADMKMARMINAWAWSMAHDKWPGYTNEIAWVDVPAWHSIAWDNRRLREEMQIREGGEQAVFERALAWQAPLDASK